MSLLFAAAPAQASKAEVTTTVIPSVCTGRCDTPGPPQTTYALVYTAAAGERNGLVLTPTADGYDLTDPGAAIETGTGCSSVDSHRVTCKPANASVTVDLGDSDDTFDGHAMTVPIKLTGGAGSDTLTGGSGDDDITVDGGAPIGDDVVDGGPGFDAVEYTDHTQGVTIDLGDPSGDQGQPGERDKFANVEAAGGGQGDDVMRSGSGPGPWSMAGGPGDDRFTGSGGEDWFNGGPGNDVLVGKAGNDILDGEAGSDRLDGGAGKDELVGGPGRDMLAGGAGVDLLSTTDRTPDRVSCGGGLDYVVTTRTVMDEETGNDREEEISPDPGDLLLRDCELVYLGIDTARVNPRGGTLETIVFSSPCTRTIDHFSVRVTAGRRVIGTLRTQKCHGGRRPVRLPVHGLRRGMVVTVHWTVNDLSIDQQASWRTILL